MGSSRVGVMWLMVVGAALLALAGPARANFFDEECKGSCKDAVKTCVHAAKAAFRSCKEDCRDVEDRVGRRACQRSCRAAIHDAKDTCREAREGCRDACEEQPPPPQECGHCRAELRVCLHEVSGEGRACVSGCVLSKLETMRACRDARDRAGCVIGLARDAAVCLRGCAHGMRGGARRCQLGHRECRSACEGGGSYGSAGQAFLLPSPSLFE